MPRFLTVLIVAPLLGLASAMAQTEMPDHQDPLAVVPYRSFQVDLASSYTWDQPDLLDAGVLIHLGLGRGWEIRVGAPPHTRVVPTPHEHTSGFGDPSIGLKAVLGTAQGWTVAATSDASLPIGSAQGGTHVETLTTVTGGRDLPASLALEVLAELAIDTGEPTPTAALGLVLSRRVLRQLDVSVDVIAGIEDLNVTSVIVQNGYALLLTPAVQAGLVVGVGVEGSAAPDALLGISVSVRR